MGTLATGARVLHVLLLGLWTGGLAFYGVLWSRVDAAVSSQHTADALLHDILSRLDAFGLVAGPLILVSLLAGWAPLQVPLRNRALGILVATGLAAVSGRWLEPRRARIVEGLGRRLEDLDPTATAALELAQIDQIGAALLVVNGLLAVLLLAAAVRGSQPRRRFGIEV